MKYIKLVISIVDEYQETLIAELFDMDFDGFQQQEDQIIAYITKEQFWIGGREHIERLLAVYPGDGYIESEEVIADQNWNEQWEQTIQPQTIGAFFVKPTWSREAPPDDKIVLEIDPKMSFGTGYHETTRLMLRSLQSVIKKDSTVVDAGTGTGILAIAAVKLGAKQVFAFDIDEWSITNAKENALLNNILEKIEIREGSAEVIPFENKYDTILANIQCNPILEILLRLSKSLKSTGIMLLSGLLEGDKKKIAAKARELGLAIKETNKENEWIALLLKKE